MAENDATRDKSAQPASQGSLDSLIAAAKSAASGARPLPPVESWNPPFCGDIDMKITRDGTWFYNGTPIGRPALVRLFSTILRKDAERFVLVTPVERVGITVEDAPFLAVEMADAAGVLRFRTNVDDWVAVDAAHPLRFEAGAADGVKPYVRVRGDLWALLKRSLFLDLVEHGDVRTIEGIDQFGVESGGIFFPMAAAADIEGLHGFRRTS